jgi:hypothetical protein
MNNKAHCLLLQPVVTCCFDLVFADIALGMSSWCYNIGATAPSFVVRQRVDLVGDEKHGGKGKQDDETKGFCAKNTCIACVSMNKQTRGVKKTETLVSRKAI